MRGYIKIDRALLDHWLWTDKPFSKGQAWIDLLALANHKDVTKLHNGVKMEFKRGTVNRSMTELAERWGWNRKTVKRFLMDTENDGMVSVVSTRTGTQQGTRITIVNYDKYQYQGTQQGTQQGTREGHGRDTDADINNNDIKNDNNDVCVARAREETHTPSFKQVVVENVAQGYGLSGESMKKFIDYNTGKGWPLEWKAALKLWADKEKEQKAEQTATNRTQRFENERSGVDYDEMQRKLIAAQRAMRAAQ